MYALKVSLCSVSIAGSLALFPFPEYPEPRLQRVPLLVDNDLLMEVLSHRDINRWLPSRAMQLGIQDGK